MGDQPNYSLKHFFSLHSSGACVKHQNSSTKSIFPHILTLSHDDKKFTLLKYLNVSHTYLRNAVKKMLLGQ